VLEVVRQDYVRTARSKGLGEARVVYRHVLRTALIPIVTVVGIQFGTLIGGTVLVEFIFNRPGISTLLFTAIQRRDYPVVQGVVLVTSAMFIGVNLIVDLSYGWLDPRIRYGGSA
jgi:peptide/nickel transport system permease protein